MRFALGVFVVIAMWAVYTCAASHRGAWQAIPLTLSVGALLTLCAIRHERARPVALRIGRGEASVWDRSDRLLAHGRVAGCSQWSGRLLVLALKPEAGRANTLLLVADSLPAPVFRELSVLGRRAAGA
jgi:hypothetical protein